MNSGTGWEPKTACHAKREPRVSCASEKLITCALDTMKGKVPRHPITGMEAKELSALMVTTG